MATFAVSTNTNYQDLTAPAGNDTYNITAKARLTIDTDTRYCTNHSVTTGNLGPVNITSGELYIDGTGVRIIPYDGGSGNVPAIGTAITQGGVSSYLLGVWASFIVAPTAPASAMPATGYIKVKNKTGGNYAVGALGGLTANATGVDVVGWIEVVGIEAATCTVPRLGKFTMRGEWFAVGVTTGVTNQTIQMPASLANTWYPGVWIETAVGSGVYEFYPNAGTATTTRQDVAGKVVWISSQGLLRINNSGAAQNGYLPVANLNIRVPNIITIDVTSAAMGTNTIPSTTLGTRYDFTTTGGGIIDIDKANLIWYPSFTQVFSVSITNTGVFSQIQIAECASPMTLTQVGIGQNAADKFNSILFTLCFAGGSISDCTFSHAILGASGDYNISMADCFGFTFNNTVVRAFGLIGNATVGSFTLTRVSNCTFTNTKIVAGRVFMVTCSNIVFTTTSYCNTPTTTTLATFGQYLFSCTANTSYFKGDGVDFWGLTNVQPYAGLIQIITGSNNIKLRNIATAAAPLNLGGTNPCQYVVVAAASAGVYAIELKRIYCYNTGAGIFNNLDNSANTVTLENVWCDAADTFTAISLNEISKGMKAVNAVAAQAAVYGTHFFDLFNADTTGRIGFIANEKTTVEPSNSSYVLDVTGTGCGFDSTGKLVMPNVTDQITWARPYYALGHQRFGTALPTLTGTLTGNFCFYYDIDKGSGYAGSFKNLVYLRTGGATTITSFNITMTSTAGVALGDYIYGTNVPADTIVVRVVDGTTVQMSKAATATGSGYTFTFNHLPITGYAVLDFVADGYVNCVIGDLGKAVVYSGGTPADTGTLLGYDNTNRKWFVQLAVAYTYANTTTAIVITTGTGTGTLSTAGTIDAIIDPTVGFKLKVRAVVVTAGATNDLKYITIPTITTLAVSQAAQYPLDLSLISISGIVTGSRIKVIKTADSSVLFNEEISGTTWSGYTSQIGFELRVEIRNASGAPYYQPWYSLFTVVTGGNALTALQVRDDI